MLGTHVYNAYYVTSALLGPSIHGLIYLKRYPYPPGLRLSQVHNTETNSWFKLRFT